MYAAAPKAKRAQKSRKVTPTGSEAAEEEGSPSPEADEEVAAAEESSEEGDVEGGADAGAEVDGEAEEEAEDEDEEPLEDLTEDARQALGTCNLLISECMYQLCETSLHGPPCATSTSGGRSVCKSVSRLLTHRRRCCCVWVQQA